MGCPSNVGHFGSWYRMLKLNNGKWGREGAEGGGVRGWKVWNAQGEKQKFIIIIVG